MPVHKIGKISIKAGMYPYRRSLDHFLRKRTLLLHEGVAAVNVVYSNHHASETVKFFWNEYSPHLIFRNPETQIYKSTIGNGPTGIKIYFDNLEEPVLLDGDLDFKEPKPITQLVEEFIKVAGCNELEYEERTSAENTNSWSTPDKSCICKVRGQCPCSRKINLPRCVYGLVKKTGSGPVDRFNRTIDLDSTTPEGTNMICSPMDKKAYYMSHDKDIKY